MCIPFMSAPRPAKADRPPRGSSKVAKPHLLESAPRPAKADRPPRGSSKVAKPHLLESRLIWPSTCPLLQADVKAALTADKSAVKLPAKRLISGALDSRARLNIDRSHRHRDGVSSPGTHWRGCLPARSPARRRTRPRRIYGSRCACAPRARVRVNPPAKRRRAALMASRLAGQVSWQSPLLTTLYAHEPWPHGPFRCFL